MTNPNNAIGTNAAYGGRTSVNAANDNLALYTSRGVVSGWTLSPDTGMTISVGGASDVRDVAVAEDAAGNRTTINNISGAPVSVTIPAAPAAGSRIDLVVAYVANPPQGSDTEVDNPGACGLIVVSGTASSSPTAPNDSAIRSAITADGAAGSTAYYAILGEATVPNGTTDIDATMLAVGPTAVLSASKLNLQNYTYHGTTSLPSINVTEAGTYLVTAELNLRQSSNATYAELDAQMEVNGTLVTDTDYILQIPPHTNYSSFQEASWAEIVTVPANSTIRINATRQNSVTLLKTSMNIVRIG